MKQPHVVHLVLQGGEGAGGDEEGVRKTFLLDCGRLQLEQVKLAFQLATVELIVGKHRDIVLRFETLCIFHLF